MIDRALRAAAWWVALVLLEAALRDRAREAEVATLEHLLTLEEPCGCDR